MKKLIPILCLAAFAALASGCVNRTITDEQPKSEKDRYGSRRAEVNVLEQKRVWFWQDDFKKP